MKPLEQRSYNYIALILVVSATVLYCLNLGGWLINDDEGTSLYAAWRLSEGDLPHRDFASEHSPFFAYLGSGLIQVFGPSIIALRCSSAILTLSAALTIFLVTKKAWGQRAAFLATLFMLLNLEVFLQGRVFRTDTYTLFFTAAGLCALIASQSRNQRGYLYLAGCLMGLGTLVKVIGVLPALGGGLFLLSRLWQERRNWRLPVLDLMAYVLPYMALLGAGYGLYLIISSDLITNLAGAQGTLGRGIRLHTLLKKGALFLTSYFRANLTLLLAIPAAVSIIKRRDRTGMILIWQLPTALIVMLMRGPQFSRYFLYLAPTWSLLLAHSVEAFFRWCESVPNEGEDLPWLQRGIFMVYRAYKRTGLEKAFVILVALLVASPWIIPVARTSMGRESATLRLAEYITELTEPDDHIVTDYASLNFHSQREGVYQTDIISWGHAAAGVLLGSDLIKEIEAKSVKLIAIHVGDNSGGAHFAAMHDFEEFYQYVRDHYVLVGEFDRLYQTFEIYLAEDRLSNVQ